MMNISKNENQKILLVAVILVILLLAVFWLRAQRGATKQLPGTFPKTASPTPDIFVGSYTLKPDKGVVKVGEKVLLTVSFTASGKKLDGADVILRFDPELFEAEETLSFGDYFSNYPRREVDNSKGIIKVTAFRVTSDQPVSLPTTLFVANFAAKKAGSATINLDFQKGKTNLSTLVEKGTSQNILGTVYPATVTIEP